MYWVVAAIAALVLLAETVAVAMIVRRKNLDRWLPSYLFGMNACPRLNRPGVRPIEPTSPNSDDAII